MQRQVLDILLGRSDPSDCFTLKWGWFTFRLKIKPISTRQLIRISGEICQIKDFEDEEMTYFQALMTHAGDAEYINRAIAIATGTRFVNIVARAISKLPNKDQYILFKIVVKNADAEIFFYTITLARKINLLKKKEE
jgi:hypothetical protein